MMDEIKTLLPVKHKDGKWVYPTQAVIVNDSKDGAESDVTVETQVSKKVHVPKSLVENYANEQKKLKNLKIKTALLCDHVTANPEKLAALKELVNMLSNPCTKMYVAEFKIVCYSLLHVFNDLLPGYKLRANVPEKDTKVKLKKQTKQLLSQETGLLRNYKSYIDTLQSAINAMKSKRALKNVNEVKKKALIEIGTTAIKCLGDLMVKKYYFNYFKAIINIVVPLTCHNDSSVSTQCCEAIQNVFKADKLGEASLDIVKQIIKIIKEKKFDVPVSLIRTFLCLRVQDAKLDDDGKKKADMKTVRKQLNSMSRKEKKYKKKMKGLEHQLRETEAQENKQMKSKFQTETLKKIFWIYFHVLKDDAKLNLVEPVLEGLSRFAYLINLEFFDDLSAVLSSLMANGNLSNIEKLHCMQTLFTILAGQAQSLNVDPQSLYSHLYNILINFQSNTPTVHFQAALKCIEIMIIRRKKNVTVNRILAFIKRLSTVAVQSPLHFALASLAMVQCLITTKKNSDVLLDTENNVGSGIFMPELEDPEYCNASSTSLWELCLLQKHYCPLVSMYAGYVLHGCSTQAKIQNDMTKLDPKEILQKMADLSDNQNIEFKEFHTPKAKRLCVRSDSVSDLTTEKMAIDWDDVMDFDMCNLVV